MDMFDNKRFCSFRLILSFAAIVKKVKKSTFSLFTKIGILVSLDITFTQIKELCGCKYPLKNY